MRLIYMIIFQIITAINKCVRYFSVCYEKRNQRLARIKVKIEEVRVSLLETGASCSLLSSSVYKKLKEIHEKLWK